MRAGDEHPPRATPVERDFAEDGERDLLFLNTGSSPIDNLLLDALLDVSINI